MILELLKWFVTCPEKSENYSVIGNFSWRQIKVLKILYPRKLLNSWTTEQLVEQLESSKLDCLIVHVGTSDLSKQINTLHSVKKIIQNVPKASRNTRVVFSNLIVRKDNSNLSKKIHETNGRLQNYTTQKILILLTR